MRIPAEGSAVPPVKSDRPTRCPKSLEPMGILIIFLIFIYRLKLKAKRLKMTLTLDERVETLHFWGFLKSQVYAVKIRGLRHLRQRITDCCATVDPNMLSKIPTNMVKRLRKCVECRGEHIEHIM
jgi:hypothetical protein